MTESYRDALNSSPDDLVSPMSRFRTMARPEGAGRAPTGPLALDREAHHLANAKSKVGAARTAQPVWVLAPRLPERDAAVDAEEQRTPALPDGGTCSESCAST